MMGATLAFLVTAVGRAPAARQQAAAAVSEKPEPRNIEAEAPPAEPPPELPFNAKLFSPDIPEPGGGVRTGGCSGALIAPDWIITAGHCFHDGNGVRRSGKPVYTTEVTVGKLDVDDPGGQVTTVVDVRQSEVNDIALAKLDSAVEDVVPLALPESEPAVGQELRFVGWGSLSPTEVKPTPRIKRGEFVVVDLDSANVEAESTVDRTVENSPCPQDSGAPLFVSDDDRTGTLVATVSTGPDCPQPGLETLARVDVVVDWIRHQVGR
ncbi:S1 family peptidase [Prauserella cavernicola]|uniref:Trypsin-like serine protease n=1 Tax=Prauserella cavernicola TaxID=2800127 RepID=A0A934R023_9PSEU|nr:trypsin-like serine protease [Prauserella cavernicola]MBK1789212.1 trypsin-like serine protease [Prauserella cavernicola]